MNEKGILYWIKKKINDLLIFFHLKKKEEEEKKKKEEEIARRMSKPEIFGKFFLGFFFGVIEYATSRPKRKTVKELVNIDDIREEIENLEKKIEWLENKIRKERRADKKAAYEKKLNHTKEVVVELKERIEIIKYNQEKAKEVKVRLEQLILELEDIKKDVEQIKSQVATTNDLTKLQLYQEELSKKQHQLKEKIDELEQIKQDYDRFANVDLSLSEKDQMCLEEAHALSSLDKDSPTKITGPIKDVLDQEVPKVLPLTRYLDEEIVSTIVYTNKKVLNVSKEVEQEVLETKNLVVKKEEEERERIRKEEEERLKNAVDEVTFAQEKINNHINEMNREIEKLHKQVDKVKKVQTKQTTHFRGISKMIVNVSKMAVGLLSFTFFKNPGVGFIVGATILNNSIRGLRNAVRLNKRRVAYYKYTDVTNEILKQKSTLKVSERLMTDSLKQIALFKVEFAEKFEDNIKILPEYQEILEKVEMVEREILEKQELLHEHKKNLNEVEKKNEKQKEKVKQME